MKKILRKVLGVGIIVASVALAGLILAWNFVMNCIGFLICAITEG